MSPFRRRHTRHRKSRTSLRWYGIILLLTVLLAAVLGLGGGLLDFIERKANVLESQFIQSVPNIPKDIDRDTLEGLKKNIDPNTLEGLKKKWDQRQFKP